MTARTGLPGPALRAPGRAARPRPAGKGAGRRCPADPARAPFDRQDGPRTRTSPRGTARLRPLCAAALALALLPAPAATAAAGAGAEPAALCEAAALAAARATGVPPEVLLALALTESGRTEAGRLRPWPWTVNADGEGRWFATREAALAFAEARRAEGARALDIGCFQINHRWHGEAFASLEAMFDPAANALHAARYLARQHAGTASWEEAAAAYHSRTPALAERYRRRFAANLAALGIAPAAPPAAPPPAAGAPPPPRRARPPAGPAPLIAAGPPASAGTLFGAAPPGAGPRPLLAPAPRRPLLPLGS